MRRPARPQRRRQVDDDADAHRAGDRRRGRDRGARRHAPGRVQGRRAPRWASCRSSTTSTRRSRSSRTCASSRTCTASRARERAAAIERALEIANLGDRRDTRVDKLSGGMRRRLLIARALVHQPRLVLLDEPTVGLDPQVRQELWALIDALRAEGISILMSTHYIEEAERLADTVTIMAEGKAVASGRPRSSCASTRARGDRGLRAAARGWPRSRPRRAPPATHAPHRHLGVACSARARDGELPEGERRPANLEDVFVLLTGEEVTDVDAARRTALGRLERPAIAGVLVREHRLPPYWGRRRSPRSSSRRSTCSRSASASARSSRRSRATTTSSSSAPAWSPPRCCSRRSSRRCSARS